MIKKLSTTVEDTGEKFSWVSCIFLLFVFFTSHHHIIDIHSYLENFRGKQEQIDADKISEATEKGDLKRQVAISSLGLFGFLLLIQKNKRVLKIKSFMSILMIFFVIWCATSLLWSENYSLTFRKIIIFILFNVGVLAVAKSFSLRNLVNLAFICSLVFFIIGVLAEVSLIASFHPFSVTYRFCGTLHPNHQGWNLAMLIFSATILANEHSHRRPFFIATAILAFVFLVLTKSRIALASAVIVMGVYWSVLSLKRNRYLAFAYFFGFISLACILPVLMEGKLLDSVRPILLLGREYEGQENVTTLSGRIPLWQQSLEFAKERPLIGYGYNAFWTPDRSLEMAENIGWGITGTHNDYINLLLGVGLTGALMFIIIMLMGIGRIGLLYRLTYNRYILFSAMMLIFYSLVMMGEMISSEVCVPNLITSVILVKIGFVVPVIEAH